MIKSNNDELNIDDRRKTILGFLNTQGKVKVNDLSREFGISEVTVRGDLDDLEKNGLLERIHGGAISTYRNYFKMNFLDRMDANKTEKQRIAAEAASAISDGDTLILGSGTTPIYVARELAGLKDLTVLTNSIFAAQELSSNKNINTVILLGGNINPKYQFTYGDDAISQLMKYKADKLILSTDGVSAEYGLTTYHHFEAEMNRQMIIRVNKTIVVADHTKVGRASFAHIGPAEGIDCLISDTDADADEISMLKKKGIEVRLV
jgi:DeoR/GlpR family transcriptional regulator of sugar metabolism